METSPQRRAPPTLLRYGHHASQFIHLHLHTPLPSPCESPSPSPAATAPPRATAILLHGGFWKAAYGIDPPTAAMDSLAPALVAAGLHAAEVEYRRRPVATDATCEHDDVSGWPHTNNDVLAAMARVAGHPAVRADRIVLVGHSAGGTLALWLTAATVAAATATPFSALRVAAAAAAADASFAPRPLPPPPPPVAVFALAPVADLVLGVRLHLSDAGDAIQNYMHGEPHDHPADYEAACPSRAAAPLLARAKVVVVAAEDDVDVPPAVAESFVAAVSKHSAAEGGNTYDTETGAVAHAERPRKAAEPRLQLIRVPGVDHYDLIDATSLAWRRVQGELLRILLDLDDVT